MRIVLIIIFFSFSLTASTVLGQPYYFTHYQVENGLSNNAVMCSLQDHNGFMWFGTRDGLNRFDGLSYKIFRNEPEDSSSIGSNAITSLSEDENNNIWVATEKGIYKYDELTEKFSQLKLAGNYSIRNLKVINNQVWYISLYTLYRYDQKTAKTKEYHLGKEVTAYCEFADGSFWIATAAGTLAHYDDRNDRFSEYDLFAHSPTPVSKFIESVYNTGNGTILIGTSNAGLKSFDTRSSTYKDVLTFNSDKTEITVREILAVSGNNYWIASQSGIYILDIQTGKTEHLTRQQSDPYSLSDNIVHTLCKDKEGGIWAGTYFGGINYYPKQYVTFKKYFPQSGMNSISGFAVREISNDGQGNIWIGTEDAGLNKLDTRTGTFTNYNTQRNNENLTYSNIHGLLVDGNKIWVGTYLHGLDVLDAATGKKIRHYTPGNSNIGSNFIYCLYKTSTGEILAGTDKGLYEYLPGTDDFKIITDVEKVFYRTLLQDRDGTVWAGTYGDGVFFYNNKTHEHGQFEFEQGNPNSLPGNLINKVFEASDGSLWFATEAGICKYSKSLKHFERYSTLNGMPSNVIYSVLEDEKKNLWISTSKGLVSFSPVSKTIKTYTKSSGLLTDQFNYNSAYKDDRGLMYFGSVKGLVTFYPDSIKSNTFSPPVFLTGFQVYNTELAVDEKGSPLKNSISYTKKLTLAYSQSTFSIDFAALSYTAPGTTRYAYKMEGLDKDWNYLATNRKVYFTDLNPGTYTFKVTAINGSTGQPGKPASITITILPPMWKTWWAYTFYALIIGGIIYILIRHFVHRPREISRQKLERLEFEKERENYNDKIEFFINVAHEIRTPLTLIKGPMENIMDRVNDMPQIRSSLEIMNNNTDRLLHLSSQLLDFRKVEMNGFRYNFTREDIVQILDDHFVSFKEAAQIKKLAVTTHFPKVFFAYIDAEAFNKIISNLWDNAIKYAGTKASVSLQVDGDNTDTYTIEFRNDGYILPQDMNEMIFKSFYRAKETAKLPGTGIGLTLSRSLAELHGGSLLLANSTGKINTFKLCLPINPKQAL